jgi:hypothetical protein
LPSSLPDFPTLSTLAPQPFTQVADASSSRPPVKKGVCWKYLQKNVNTGKRAMAADFYIPEYAINSVPTETASTRVQKRKGLRVLSL